LSLTGVPDPVIEDGFAPLWHSYIRELRQELAAPAHRTLVYPGIPELLAALERRRDEAVLGLLTGNIAEGAALKLQSAGIRSDFRVGAFGSDCERRDGLPPVAVERARAEVGVTFCRRDIVIIGDTPSDVTCGHALGVRAIAVATGNHAAGDLEAAGAEAVFADLSDTERVLDAILC
jgi:phosphoglycolate phosphatase